MTTIIRNATILKGKQGAGTHIIIKNVPVMAVIRLKKIPNSSLPEFLSFRLSFRKLDMSSIIEVLDILPFKEFENKYVINEKPIPVKRTFELLLIETGIMMGDEFVSLTNNQKLCFPPFKDYTKPNYEEDFPEFRYEFQVEIIDPFTKPISPVIHN